MGCDRSPPPWYFVKTSAASSYRPFRQSHRGDSGMNHTPHRMIVGGSSCRPRGIRHATSPVSLAAAYATPVDRMDPV
jgi:hypothetical protein